MKKLLMLVVMLVVAVVAMAQTSNKISYQAVVRDANNRLVASEPVDVKVTITYTGTHSPYTEEFSPVQTNQNGLISLLIGDGAHFDEIDWNTVTTIKTEITVGSTTLTSEVPVTAVPFALYASDVNPSGGTVAEIYAKIKADSLTVFDTLHTYYYTQTQVDNKLAAKADTATTYTRDALNKMLAAKADTATTYTRDALNKMLAAKADTATTYTRTVLDNKLGAKADTATTYTRDALTKMLAAKADTATTYTRDALTKMLAAKADTATTYTRTVLDNKLGAKADTATTYTRDALNKMLAAKADTATTYTRDALNKMLAAKADTATTYTREALNKMLGAKADTSDVYTRVALDTMLAAKADTSDIHNAKVTIKSALSADPIKEFTLNTEVDQEINLPANPLTLKFVNGSDTVFSYNAFKDQTAEPGVVDNYFVIDLGDSLSTKAIVRYINGAKANTAVNDVDSIYNALANNADVKKALLAKAKEVAKNHRRDAIDVAISYFKNLSSDDIRYILNNVSSTDIANFVSKLSTTLTSTDVNNIISGLTSSITAAQVENLIDALNNSSTGITPAQVNHFIDYLNNAANANPSSAAGVLKARLDAHINALIEAH